MKRGSNRLNFNAIKGLNKCSVLFVMQKLNIFIYWLNKLQNTNIGFLLYLYLKKSDKDVKTFNRFIGDNQMVVTKIIQAITLFNKFLSAIEQKREYINK